MVKNGPLSVIFDRFPCFKISEKGLVKLVIDRQYIRKVYSSVK